MIVSEEKIENDKNISDEMIVTGILNGKKALYELILRRYNQRIFRVVFAITSNREDTKDIMQETYLKAYKNLHQFEHKALFSTWLTKIAIYEALAQVRKIKPWFSIDDKLAESLASDDIKTTPEYLVHRQQFHDALESILKQLPANQRLVFIMRDVEQMGTAETAECLGISAQNVKVRLHRTRQELQQKLQQRIENLTTELHLFGNSECDALVHFVLRSL